MALLLVGCDASNGRSGRADTDGVDATDATDGTDGAEGTDGTNGSDGTDGSTDGTDGGEAIVDLRADTNRDGVVDFDDPTDDEGEDAWTATAGAIFLANIDDDALLCDPAGKSDVELPECHDALDEEINGPEDHLDLARIWVAPWAGAPDDAVATVTISETAAPHVRLFKRVAKGNPIGFLVVNSGDTLTLDELREGIELALEAKDIVRDTEVWDGLADITLTVARGGETVGTDTVQLRVSPVMTYHHLLPAETVYASRFNSASSIAFRGDLEAAIAIAGLPNPLYNVDYPDQWTQDFFETGFMSMPGPDGQQHAIRVNIRSANVFNPGSQSNPLRFAGRVVFDLRGKDSGAIQEFDRQHAQANGYMDSLNSFGNYETIPPYSHNGQSYPLGRMFRGSIESFYTDPSFTKMMEAQGVQPPVYVDTSWLLVGHVDETVTFVPVDNERGWTIAVNDPTLALQMLQKAEDAGFGDAVLFEGKNWDNNTPAATTISQVLANETVLDESAKAVTEVQAQLDILMAETGITEEEIIRIPFLHEPVQGWSVAYQPGTVNGIWLNPTNFAVPNPHGPVIDGEDIFKKQLADEFGKYGITVHFVEDWDLYHVLLGEVHCGSNATRAIPDARWWEAGL